MTAPLRLTDRKREAIIQAAIEAFRADGFEATSMDKIAAKAEVSKRTVYNHFPSKEELFAESCTTCGPKVRHKWICPTTRIAACVSNYANYSS